MDLAKLLKITQSYAVRLRSEPNVGGVAHRVAATSMARSTKVAAVIALCATVCAAVHGADVDNRPVVGVLTLPNYFPQWADKRSYFPASYVKWLESGGTRVVPIPYTMNSSDVETLFESLNGVRVARLVAKCTAALTAARATGAFHGRRSLVSEPHNQQRSVDAVCGDREAAFRLGVEIA